MPDDGKSFLAETCSLLVTEYSVLLTDWNIHLYLIMPRQCGTLNCWNAVCSVVWSIKFCVTLREIHPEVQKVDKNFESNTANPSKFLSDLVMLIYFLMKKIFLSTYSVERNVLNSDSERNLDPTVHLEYAFELKTWKSRERRLLVRHKEIFPEKCAFDSCGFLPSSYSTDLPKKKLSVTKNFASLLCKSPLLLWKSMIPTLEASNLDSDTTKKVDFRWRNLVFKWQNVNDSGRFWCEV
jgi:hypothetical protein